MIVSCRAHGCIFLSFLLKRQKITTVGSERQKITTVGSERQKKSAMGRSVPKRWAQVDFTAGSTPPRMFCLVSRATNVRARTYAHGHVCARARA